MKEDKHVITEEDVEEINQHGRWLSGCLIIFFGLIVIGVLLEGC